MSSFSSGSFTLASFQFKQRKTIFSIAELYHLYQKNPSDPWYLATPIGKNTLGSMVKDIFIEAGLSGNKSNHSLTVAGATSLYAAGVLERVVQGRTGHVSLEALRKYQVTEKQEMAVSKILVGESETFKNSKLEANVTEDDCKVHVSSTIAVPPPSGSTFQLWWTKVQPLYI